MGQPVCNKDPWHELETRTIMDGDSLDNGLGAKDGVWNMAYHLFDMNFYCELEYRVIMERINLHSCERFKAKLMLQGWENDTKKYYYDLQTIFQFTFGPWFAKTFPEIANGYDEWGNRGINGKRSLVD